MALARYDPAGHATVGGPLVVGQGTGWALVLAGLGGAESDSGGNREHAAAGRQASGEIAKARFVRRDEPKRGLR